MPETNRPVTDHLGQLVGEFGPALIKKFLQVRRKLIEQGPINPTGVHSKFSYPYTTDSDILEPVHRLCAEVDLVLLTLKCSAREVLPLRKISGDAPNSTIIIPGTALVDITLLLADAESGEYILFEGSGFQEDASADKSLSKAQGNGLKHCVKALFLLVAKDEEKPTNEKPRTKGSQDNEKPRTKGSQGNSTSSVTWIDDIMQKIGCQDKQWVAKLSKELCGGKLPSALVAEADKKRLRDALFVHWALNTAPEKFGDFDDAEASYRQLVTSLSNAKTSTILEAWRKTVGQLQPLRTNKRKIEESHEHATG